MQRGLVFQIGRWFFAPKPVASIAMEPVAVDGIEPGERDLS